MPSLERALKARTPSGIMGILTTILRCQVASSWASRMMPSKSVETTSAFTTPSLTISQISRMCSRNGRFSLATSVGLVVTPSTTPRATPRRISSRFAVSRKIFMAVKNPAFVQLQFRTLPNGSYSSDAASGRDGSCGIGHHGIAQRADAVDGDLDDVAGLQRADAGGRARGDDVAGKQRHHAREPAEDEVRRKSHVNGARELLALAVDEGLDGRPAQVELRLDERPHRAECIEALATSPLAVGPLQIAGGHIVETHIAQKKRPRVIALAQIAAGAADDQRQLTLVVDALRKRRQHDGFSGADDRRGWLQENHRLLGHFAVEFGGVFLIVFADADD